MNTRRNTEGDEKLETIVLEKPDEYDLLIRSVTVGWYGNLMGGLWLKQVSTEEYQKISGSKTNGKNWKRNREIRKRSREITLTKLF